jgi:hypothetical protein
MKTNEYSVIAENHTYIENLHNQHLDLEGDGFEEVSSEGSLKPNLEEFQEIEVHETPVQPEEV